MTEHLTRRQQDVLDYLSARHRRREQPPSLSELCEGLNLRSRGSMHKHVQALIQAGLVESMEGKQRGVRLVRPPENPPEQLSLFGYIAAGQPIEALENPEHIEVPSYLRTEKECYVLQIRGDSMIEEGILDGDWVVIEQRDYARNGEIVVALIDGREATLKKIEQRPGEVKLLPANPELEPMTYPAERIRIQGVVVGQMRAYR
jgi:repressor LexA